MIVMNNASVFGDLIYEPTTGARQSRLNLIAATSTEWNGSVDAQGFILNQDNVDISDCVVYTSEILLDPMPTQPITECGCPCEGIDEILSICIDKANTTTPRCNDIKAGTTPKKDIETGFYIITKDVLDKNGTSVGTTESVFMSKTCCTAIGGVSTIMYSQYINGLATNGSSMSPSSGYVCCSSKTNCGCIVACKWKLLDNSGNVIPPIQIPQNSGNLFLKFKTSVTEGYGM
jgi:hypothetical protein